MFVKTKFIAQVAFLMTLVGSGQVHAADSKLIAADGSSTVFPITSAIAEEFQKSNPNIRVTVGISGTGGGFKRFTRGETDISNASRPITGDELQMATQNKVTFIELPVAYDGIAVVVNPKNDFITSMTSAELKRIWQKDSTVKMWSDVRPNWPKRAIKLYGPGTDSGTFDYFTAAINGKEKSSRPDFTASEDDNSLVTGVAGDRDALGYFGFAYYEHNASRLKLVSIDNGNGPVAPSVESIANGTYQPLSRPIFIYVSQRATTRPEVDRFVRFYMQQAAGLVRSTGYIPLSPTVYELALQRYIDGTSGTIFAKHGSQLNVKLEDMLASGKKLPNKAKSGK